MSDRNDVQTEHVRRLRVGHGANCSSIGSVVDTLFATAVAGAAVFAAVVAALNTERVHVVRPPKETHPPKERTPPPGSRTP